MNLIFTCGGTAGHINPAIAVANMMRERHPDCNILFIGAKGHMEEKLVPQAGYDLKCLEGSGLSRGKNLDAVKKVLAAISTTDGQNALWQNNQGGSSYLNGVEFDLPEAYTSVAGALAAGNVYCPWNEWGSAAGAHETYGTEMQSYLLGAQDLSTTLQTVDEVVSELLSK